MDNNTLFVKNAEGEPDTQAQIIIQNKIDYTPKVSVIIPVYNTEEYLRECLDSVVSQTLKEIEIICVDDGSTDGSLEILKEYAKKDERITVITQQNLHAGVARNAGLAVAKGEYLSFLDSDDFFELEMLEELYEHSQSLGAEICVFPADSYNIKNNTYSPMPWSFRENRVPNKKSFSADDIKKFIFNFSQPWAWNKFFLTSYIREHTIAFQSVKRTNDFYFTFMALTQAKKISTLNKVLVHYRTGQLTNLQATNADSPKAFYHAYMKTKNKLMDLGLFQKYEQSFVNNVIGGSQYNLGSIKDENTKENLREELAEKLAYDLGIMQHLNNLEYFYDKALVHNFYANVLMYRLPKIKYATPPKVSVIMPCYNTAPYLRQALDSVVNQTLKDIEIIAVDDGSTDDSGRILDEYAARDGRLRVIHKANAGYGHSMNVGLDNASGEYIGILEPDDYLALDMYETLYNKAKEFDLDVVKSDYFKFDSDNGAYKYTKEKLSDKPDYYNVLMSPNDFPDLLLRFTTNWAGIFKRDFLQKFNIRHNETPGAAYQDNGFWVQTMYQAKRIMFLENNFYCYRQDNPNQSMRKRNNLWTIPDEYDFIDKVFENNNAMLKYRKIYCYRKFNAYTFHLKARISPEYWTEYLTRMAEVFRKEEEQGYLDFSCFSESAAKELRLILEKNFDGYRHLNIKALSVIIPVYNVENYLRECLDSVINQTLKDIEIICVDDGSTDNSLEILKEYAAKDKRITLLTQTNQKQGAARNNALNIAKGEYVMFVDSDDYVDLSACEKLYSRCRELDLDMLSYGGTNFDNDTRESLPSPYYEFKYLPADWDEEVFNYKDCISFLTKMAVTTWLTIYKRSFLKKNNIFFPEKLYFEDNVFFIKAVTQADRISIDRASYYHRRIHQSQTTQNWDKHFNDYLAITDILLSWIKEHKNDLLSAYTESYLRTALNFYDKFSFKEKEIYYENLRELVERYTTAFSPLGLISLAQKVCGGSNTSSPLLYKDIGLGCNTWCEPRNVSGNAYTYDLSDNIYTRYVSWDPIKEGSCDVEIVRLSAVEKRSKRVVEFPVDKIISSGKISGRRVEFRNQKCWIGCAVEGAYESFTVEASVSRV